MRRSLLFCLAAAASVALAGPVLAQSDQTQPGQPTTSASSPSSTTTVTGTIVSSSDKQLVIDTPTGRQTFTVVSGTSDVPTGLTAGTQVTVQFTTSGGERTVSRVTTVSSSSPYGSSSPSGSTSPSTSSTSPYSSSGTSSSTTSPRSSTGTYSSGTSGQYGSTGTSTDRDDVTRGTHTDRDHNRRTGTTDNDRDNNLPATASPAFLVGFLGLLSLGGSALVRALRRLL